MKYTIFYYDSNQYILKKIEACDEYEATRCLENAENDVMLAIEGHPRIWGDADQIIGVDNAD